MTESIMHKKSGVNWMFSPIVEILYIILDIYSKLIIGQFIVSWLIYFDIINTRQKFVGMIVNFLYQITEPFYARIRRFVPHIGGVDLSPLVALLLVHFAQLILIRTIAPLLG